VNENGSGKDAPSTEELAMDGQIRTSQERGTDFFGTLNEMPPEPIGLLIHVLEAMASEPTFRAARRGMLSALALTPGAQILEAGCGTGVALPDLVEIAEPSVRVYGIDTTEAFLEVARERAQGLGVDYAEYRSGDIRRIPYPDDFFDAAFCEKVLLHVGPAGVALTELARVVRPGGRIGALEWQPHFALSCSRPELEARWNGLLRHAVHNYLAAPSLAYYFKKAGLEDVRTRVYVAEGERLENPPFWRAFLVDQLPLFVGAGVLPMEEAEALAAELQALDAEGCFRASLMIWTAVGRKPSTRS
jgi:ubiquinone/menaquinone biosynthesis C-methylase UbiE